MASEIVGMVERSEAITAVVPPPDEDDDVVAVVTGVADSGNVGYETAKRLVTGGHVRRVILGGNKEMKNQEKQQFCDSFTSYVESQLGDRDGGREQAVVEYKHLELESFESIKKFVQELQEVHHINYLVHCAETMFVKFEKTGDGFERHFQVNHLGPALLTLELQPLLKKGGERKSGAKVVIVASAAHSSAEFDPSNINGERCYSRFMAYYNSKLYSLMFADCLQRRLDNISVVCVDPGRIRSKLILEACQNSRILKIISNIILQLRYEAVRVGGRRVADCVVGASEAVTSSARSTSSSTPTAPGSRTTSTTSGHSDSEDTQSSSSWRMQYFHKRTLHQEKMSASARDVRSQKRLWEITVAAVKKFLTDTKFTSTELEENLLLEEVKWREEEAKRKRAPQSLEDNGRHEEGGGGGRRGRREGRGGDGVRGRSGVGGGGGDGVGDGVGGGGRGGQERSGGGDGCGGGRDQEDAGNQDQESGTIEHSDRRDEPESGSTQPSLVQHAQNTSRISGLVTSV